MRLILALSIVLLTAAAPALAATLKLQVNDQGGKPLADAVATLYPEQPDAVPQHPAAPHDHIVNQKDETFVPLVEVVPTGETVIFRNSDRTRHHVYTFSPLAPFDFILKPNESSPAIRLPKSGVIPIGCNIHDFMISYLFVTDARWAAKSDEKGTAVLSDVPPGNYTVKLWHPRLRPGAQQPAQQVTVSGEQASASLSMTVMAPQREDDKY